VEIPYEKFMKLDASSRRARFERANAETRATIMRTHAERWLAANRARLTSAQVDLVQQVIALVTPALYRNPTDPELKKQLDALEARLRCASGVNETNVLSSTSSRSS
jgi:endonuclease/exonuclease/phosphatase (EEP) superfamily protein YafD